MKDMFGKIKAGLKRHALKIVLFSYALALGTSLPLVFSRCSANCLSCGSCTLYLGIVPVIAAVALRNKIKRGWKYVLHGLSRRPEERL